MKKERVGDLHTPGHAAGLFLAFFQFLVLIHDFIDNVIEGIRHPSMIDQAFDCLFLNPDLFRIHITIYECIL